MSQQAIHNHITGVILAGGQARRLGGQDKGLIELCGRTLVEHSIHTLTPQVQTLMISANRHIEQYRAFGHEVIEDQLASFEGPLAGLQRSLQTVQTPLLATLPCDAPLAPKDFVARLQQHFIRGQTLAVIAYDGERLQPLFGLFSQEALPSLSEYLAQDGRKVQDWVNGLSPALVDFSDCAEAFRNINTPEDLQAIRESMTCQTTP